jgi:hypothetical protein
VRELGNRRIREIAAFAADHHRRRRGRHAELPKQRLGLLVGLQIEPGERDRVAVAKSLRRCASGENRDPMILMPSNPSLKSSVRRVRNAFRHDLPDFRQRVHGLTQRGGRQLQHLATCGRAPGHERGASRQRVHVAREFPGSWNRHLARVPRDCSTISTAPPGRRRRKTRGPLPGTARRRARSGARGPTAKGVYLGPAQPGKAISCSDGIS